MKIGFFVDVFYPMIDGVIKVVDNYARLLTEKGNDVTVFCPNGLTKHDDSVYPYRVVRCESLSIDKYDYVVPMPALDANFMNELRKCELDVVHIHSPFAVGMIGRTLAKKRGIPVVATIHSQYKLDFERNLKLKKSVELAMRAMMQVFNACDECYTVNEAIRRLYVDEYGLTAPCYIRPNATAHTPIKDKMSAYKFVNDMFSLKETDLVFLFVGRINFLKNLDFLIRSLKVLKDKGVAFKTLFVGNGQDEDELKELAKDNLNMARDRLIDILCNYQGFKQCNLILVFDAYKVKGNVGSAEKIHNINVVYTKEAETADMYIEKITHEIGKKHRVRVATSDNLEQIIILGNGATRLSANELLQEVKLAEKTIMDIINSN